MCDSGPGEFKGGDLLNGDGFLFLFASYAAICVLWRLPGVNLISFDKQVLVEEL